MCYIWGSTLIGASLKFFYFNLTNSAFSMLAEKIGRVRHYGVK